MQFWFVECAGKVKATVLEMQLVLKEWFIQCTHKYHVDAKFNQLQMQPGQWEAANRELLNLRAQVPWKAPEDIFCVYASMLTQDCMETVSSKQGMAN